MCFCSFIVEFFGETTDYMADGTSATLYFFDGGYRWIVPGPESPQVREEFDRSKHDIYAAQAQGVWRDVRHLGDDVIYLGNGPQPLRALRATFRLKDSEGKSKFSQLIIAATNNLLLIVRLTFDSCNDSEWQEAVVFLLGWVRESLRDREVEEDRSDAGENANLSSTSVPPSGFSPQASSKPHSDQGPTPQELSRCSFCGCLGHTAEHCTSEPGGVCVVCGRSVSSYSKHRCPKRVTSAKDGAAKTHELGEEVYPSEGQRIAYGFELLRDADDIDED